MGNKTERKLPSYFKPLLWSYIFDKLDLDEDKKAIIVNTINYGDLKHWRWIIKHYGKEDVKRVLTTISFTEIRARVAPLVAIIFSINKFNHAPRGNS